MIVWFVYDILSFLFPQVCLWCNKAWWFICYHCLKLVKSHPEICPICHLYSQDYKICYNCKLLQSSLYGVMIGFQYSGLMKKLILALKYYHKYTVASWLGQKLALLVQTNTLLGQNLRDWKAVVTHIPSHWTRHHFVKWYNQSQLLASALSSELKLKHITLVQKHKLTRSQTGQSRPKRQSQIQWSFVLTGELPKDIKTILIIDDVLTTGATFIQVAETIKHTYPHVQIWWIAVARSRS